MGRIVVLNETQRVIIWHHWASWGLIRRHLTSRSKQLMRPHGTNDGYNLAHTFSDSSGQDLTSANLMWSGDILYSYSRALETSRNMYVGAVCGVVVAFHFSGVKRLIHVCMLHAADGRDSLTTAEGERPLSYYIQLLYLHTGSEEKFSVLCFAVSTRYSRRRRERWSTMTYALSSSKSENATTQLTVFILATTTRCVTPQEEAGPRRTRDRKRACWCWCGLLLL